MFPLNPIRAILGLALLGLLAIPGAADAQVKIAVIESERIVTESTKGQAALEQLKQLREQKMAEARTIQNEINDLRKRLDEGGNALSEDKQAELRKQYEDKVIAARRFQDDADRDLAKLRDETLAKIEKEVLQVIDQIGQEGDYTIILNKFQSGLVYADDAIDITDQVIQRFNAGG